MQLLNNLIIIRRHTERLRTLGTIGDGQADLGQASLRRPGQVFSAQMQIDDGRLHHANLGSATRRRR